jgi:hypothetical protein
MSANATSNEAWEQGDEILREACLQIVRYLSSVAMDPHLYFEQKMKAEIAGAGPEELRTRLRQLIDWVSASGLLADHAERLDAQMAERGLPTFSSLAAE